MYFEDNLVNKWDLKAALEEYYLKNDNNLSKTLSSIKLDLEQLSTRATTLKSVQKGAEALLKNWNKTSSTLKNYEKDIKTQPQDSESPNKNSSTSAALSQSHSDKPLQVITNNMSNNENITLNQNTNVTFVEKTSEIQKDLQRNESFSSNDETPTRTTRSIFKAYDDESIKIPEFVWVIGASNISEYLHQYRIKSLEYNANVAHRELSPSRKLSLDCIYFFPKNKSKSCVCYIENNTIDSVYKDIESTIPGTTLPREILYWSDELKELYKDGETFDIELKFAEFLTQAGQSKDRQLVACTRILIELVDICKGNGLLHTHRNAEDTFAHNSVIPFLKHIFQDHNIRNYWANTQLSAYEASPATSPSLSSSSSSSTISAPSGPQKKSQSGTKFRPDFTTFAYLFDKRYDLFVVEIKPPKSSVASEDETKIGKELKKMLNVLINIEVESPQVCGLWVNGYSCKLYTMDIKGDALYRLMEVGSFDLPKSIDDIIKTRDIMLVLEKAKTIITNTTSKLENTIKYRKHHRDDIGSLINFDTIPKRKWARECAGSEERIKKIKKTN